ncbi:hypothetical protein TRFO_30265 [Tritrichomonas foetus]|uniref:Uncharacterized protein n=1 Tax=Tritrichomonas foetus TaxID=1144522 RepID=A0A1J4JYD6_9EUKA|nr:hypothetical protein TRFO_30265 [Tritrichomonas foetus]|eukprot:OHT02540.1 hypothetical protein TRFO_30265 [Tritrichomonas foetus]
MVSFSQKYFPAKHFHAIIFRRWTLVKRSVRSVVISMVGTLIFSALAIVLQWLMVTMMVASKRPITFNIYTQEPRDFIVIGDKSQKLNVNMTNAITQMYKQDVGDSVNFIYYPTTEQFNHELYHNLTKAHFPLNVPFGIEANTTTNLVPIGNITIPLTKYNFNILYNSSGINPTKQQMWGIINVNRALWKLNFGLDSDIQFSMMKLLRRLSQRIFGQLGPMLITCGLVSIVPLFISQPITDITGEVRQYMASCTLKMMPYWTATFLIDFAIWFIVTTVVWALFNACYITSFHDNLFNTWYSLVFVGPSFILFTYFFLSVFHHLKVLQDRPSLF